MNPVLGMLKAGQSPKLFLRLIETIACDLREHKRLLPAV